MAHSVDLREAAVRLYEESGRGYRVVAKELWSCPDLTDSFEFLPIRQLAPLFHS